MTCCGFFTTPFFTKGGAMLVYHLQDYRGGLRFNFKVAGATKMVLVYQPLRLMPTNGRVIMVKGD